MVYDNIIKLSMINYWIIFCLIAYLICDQSVCFLISKAKILMTHLHVIINKIRNSCINEKSFGF